MNAEALAVLIGLGGQQVMIDTPDGPADTYRFDPAETPDFGQWPIVLMYPDAVGVRPGMFSMARTLSDAGYTVLLPNLYFRSGDYPAFDMATVFSEEQEGARLGALAQSLSRELAMEHTASILGWCDEQGISGPIGCVGYCMGGGLALSAAGRFPDRVAAAASFHGARLATNEADSPHLLAPEIKCKLYVGVAGVDPYFPEDECARLLTAMQQAGVDIELEIYTGAEHGFAVLDVPQHHAKAAEHHWHSLRSLLARTIGPLSALS